MTVSTVDLTTNSVYTFTETSVSNCLKFFNHLQSAIDRITGAGHYRFLDFIDIKFATLLSSRAIIVLASSYVIVSYRLSSSFDQRLADFHGS